MFDLLAADSGVLLTVGYKCSKRYQSSLQHCVAAVFKPDSWHTVDTKFRVVDGEEEYADHCVDYDAAVWS